MTQNYELYFILDINLDEAKQNEVISELQNFIQEKLEGKNIEVEKEGVKRFAYPIKKVWTGNYTNLIFDLDLDSLPKIKELERKLNLTDGVVRYLLTNQTEFLKQKSKETTQSKKNTPESSENFSNLKEFHTAKKSKQCYPSFLGMRVIDYKDIAFLENFTSSYAKILSSKKTGNKAKVQRKVKQAIKRARHMALLPFSTKHF